MSSIEKGARTLTNNLSYGQALSCQFISAGHDLTKQIRSKSDDDCLKHIFTENSEMLFETVDEGYILNAINRLEKVKASCPDKVTIKLVKEAAISITYPLRLIYNESLTKGIFPDI